jgi:hypothetical protein
MPGPPVPPRLAGVVGHLEWDVNRSRIDVKEIIPQAKGGRNQGKNDAKYRNRHYADCPKLREIIPGRSRHERASSSHSRGTPHGRGDYLIREQPHRDDC